MNIRNAVTLLGLVAIAFAVPVKQNKNDDEPIKILRQEQEIELDGSYRFGYETEDGIVREESGGLVPDAEGNLGQHNIGQFVYTSPEGKVISETFTAGVEGFVPESDSLPVGPPTPDIIVELVKLLLSLPRYEDPYFSQKDVQKTVITTTTNQKKKSGKKGNRQNGQS